MPKIRRDILIAGAIAGALVCASRAGAAMIFTDAGAFDSALERVHAEAFESFSVGDGVFTLGFDGAVTGDASFTKVKENRIVTGGVEPAGGDRAWLLRGGVTTIALSGLDVNAIGLHYLDRGPVIFTISLIGATTETATVSGGTSGFLGLVGAGAAQSIEIAWTNAQGQAVQFDGVRVGWLTAPAATIPAPGPVSLASVGLLIGAWRRRS